MPQLDFTTYSSGLKWILLAVFAGYVLFRFVLTAPTWTMTRLQTNDRINLWNSAGLLVLLSAATAANPIDQFLILPIALAWGRAITNFTVTKLVVFAIIAWTITWGYQKMAFHYARAVVIPGLKTLSTGGISPIRGYDQIYVFLFLFILFSNLLGMVPYTMTITSFAMLTFFLSFTVFIGINIIALTVFNTKIVTLFLPSGTPLAIAPFLVLIELLSYVARAFSLGIRLFANMLAGHALVKILASFAWAMFSVGLGSIAALLPWGAIFAVTGLEIVIAGLQAYVFVTLANIYLLDAVHAH